MTTRRIVVLAAVIVCLAGVGFAQDEELPISNWSAPPFWNPAVHPRADGESPGGMLARTEGMQAQSLPSSPLPFVAITPCRIVDTRVAVSDGFHQPNFIDGEARTFPFPSSTDSPGLPATAGAWSVNIEFRPISQLSYLTAYPTGTTMPTVSTLTAGPAAWTQNAAIVPAGTAGTIDIYCQYAGRVVIDINGYYGPSSVVTSLNAKIGDVTLAQGSNVTITPSGNTLTIAATGGPGGHLPLGSADQTLRHNGSAWVASSALTNTGTDVGISGNLLLPSTGTTNGQLWIGGIPFLHAYHGPGTSGKNTFVGLYAGNFTMSGTGDQGSANVGVGDYALNHNTTGYYNGAHGYASLYQNTTGYENTASGFWSLYTNTTGHANTATGYLSLYSNTTGIFNTASGSESLAANTTGYGNTATGFGSLQSNTTGQNNTGFGAGSLQSNVTGTKNAAFGANAGGTNTTGWHDTFLGGFSNAAAADLENATAVGGGAVVDASNHVRIGNTSVTQIGGQVGWSNLSDARAKTDIRDLDLGLDFVMVLRPVAFSLKSGNGRTAMGFLAQDVEALLGDDYAVLGIGGDPDRMLSLRYTDLIAPLVKAVQEQQATIQHQRADLEDLHATIAQQKAEIETLKVQRAEIEELRRQVQVLTAARENPKPWQVADN
jgi:hypothetical protein